jgi:hypothetical protein
VAVGDALLGMVDIDLLRLLHTRIPRTKYHHHCHMKHEQNDLTPAATFIRSVYLFSLLALFSVPIFPCLFISEQNGV